MLRKLWAAGLLAAALAIPSVWARTPPDSFADLAEKLLPAVVNISTSQTVDSKSGDNDEVDPDDPMDQWFKEFDRRRKNEDEEDAPGKSRKHKQASLGSGFIIDKSGYIVTNDHVIEHADKISVILHDDTVLDAKLVGRDEKTDIALLKVDANKPLATVPWGDSDKARVGDWAIAIGNPFGLGGTVTAGIISARARDIQAGQYDDYLQTDAAINRGNSGGPLFNVNGEVIGINTAIFSPSGASAGVGFAVSANLVKPVLRDLRQYGRTRRGWLGVQIQSVSPEMAEGLGLDRARGAMISSVATGGPAARAQLEVGDVILAFDGKAVETMRNLPRIVAETPIDKMVEVAVWRKGKQASVRVKVAELKEEGAKVSAASDTDDMVTPEEIELADLGLTVTPTTESMRKHFQLDDTATGLVVLDVDDDSDAASKGIRRGDVIEQIQQAPVANAEDAKRAIQKAKQDKRSSVLLRVLSGKRVGFVGIKLAG